MESSENRNKVYGALQEALKQDKARTNILKISELGLVEMTRKRTRENLVQQLCEPCSNCEGRGYVLSCESMAYKVLREIRKDLPRFCGRQIAISVNPRVAEMLLARAHKACAELGRELGREIEVRSQPGLHQEQFEVTALDSGPPVSIPLQWLGFPPEPGEERASGAESQAEADEPSSAAEPDATESADVAEAETEPTPSAEAAPSPDAEAAPSSKELEASQEASEAEMGESAAALEPAGAESAPEPAPEDLAPEVASSEPPSRKSTGEVAPREQATGESSPEEGTSEAEPAEDDPAAEPPIAASTGAAEGEKRFAPSASAAEMLDLEAETPILPHPVKVEES